MQHRPSDKNLPNILYVDLVMYDEDLSRTLPVFFFEPSPVDVVDAHAKQLHEEKKSAQSQQLLIKQQEVATCAELQEDMRKLRSMFENSQLESQRQANQLRDMDERHEKDMVSLWERIERLDKEIECQGEDIGRLEQELRNANDRLRDINDELRDMKDELRDTKDGLRETQATVKELGEECDFFKNLHLRKLLDESRGIIASEFGASKWKPFVEKHNRQHLPAVIQSKFSASLTPECIEFLCDDDSAGRFRGNKASRHEDSDKMHEAIADDEVNPTTNRQYLSMLYKFITSQTVVLN